MAFYRSRSAISAPSTGIAGLPARLTINSMSVSPKFYYQGNNFSGGNWSAQVGGVSLSLAGLGSAPTTQIDPLNGWQTTNGVKYNDGQHHEAASGETTLDIGTGDIVIEAVFQMTSVNTGFPAVFSSIDDFTTGTGIELVTLPGSTASRIYFKSTGVAAGQLIVGGMTLGTYYHILAFVNRDEASTNGALIYKNGSLAGSADLSAHSANSFTQGIPMKFGEGRTDEYRDVVVAVGMWEQASWFAAGTGSHGEWGDLANARANAWGF